MINDNTQPANSLPSLIDRRCRNTYAVLSRKPYADIEAQNQERQHSHLRWHGAATPSHRYPSNSGRRLSATSPLVHPRLPGHTQESATPAVSSVKASTSSASIGGALGGWATPAEGRVRAAPWQLFHGNAGAWEASMVEAPSQGVQGQTLGKETLHLVFDNVTYVR